MEIYSRFFSHTDILRICKIFPETKNAERKRGLLTAKFSSSYSSSVLFNISNITNKDILTNLRVALAQNTSFKFLFWLIFITGFLVTTCVIFINIKNLFALIVDLKPSFHNKLFWLQKIMYFTNEKEK